MLLLLDWDNVHFDEAISHVNGSRGIGDKLGWVALGESPSSWLSLHVGFFGVEVNFKSANLSPAT